MPPFQTHFLPHLRALRLIPQPTTDPPLPSPHAPTDTSLALRQNRAMPLRLPPKHNRLVRRMLHDSTPLPCTLPARCR